MKRIGFIYEKICDKANIRQAILNASNNKKNKSIVQYVLRNIDKCVDEVYDLLSQKKYVPAPYVESVIKDGLSKKSRVIHKPRFYPDQVVHWALMSYYGWLIHSDSYILYKKYYKNINLMKGVIANATN